MFDQFVCAFLDFRAREFPENLKKIWTFFADCTWYVLVVVPQQLTYIHLCLSIINFF